MIDPKKLMRSVFLALAVLVTAPIAGVGGGLIGVASVQAQTAGRPVASVSFEGNQRFSDDQLLTMVDVSSGGVYSEPGVQRDLESVKIAYDKASFRNVKVTARTEALPDGRVRVIIVIDEGQRSGIAAVNFTGNNTFNSGVLKGIISTKETGFLSWLLRDDTYDEQKLALDKELIRVYYANHGFPDAVVTSAVAEFDTNRNAYFINYTIVEGERYKFGNIGIETSIPGLNSDQLKGFVRTHEGSSYSLANLQRSVEDVAYESTSQGYSFADVRPRLDRDVANHRFNVTYLVDEGARLYVERINITGNLKTRDYVIRRELDFAEGDPFNRSIVTRGKSEIEKLGFFKVVDVSTEPGSAPDKVIININVQEQSTGDYGITVGYSTNDGILGEVSLTERNFLGRGQYLRVAVGATGSGKSFDFSFTEPRFMGMKISSGVDFYHRINDETGSAFYGTTATGGQVRFGLPVTRDLSATVFTGLEHKVFADADNNSTIVNDGQEANKAWGGYTLTYNTLDNAKKPTEGFLATFTQQYVGWDHSYIKSEARARYFMPLIEGTGVIASVRGQVGVINNLDDSDLSATEAFIPGATLVRGFETRGLGPRLTTGEYLGATLYAGLSAEIEFPLPILPETYGLRGAIWGDVAFIDNTPGTNGGIVAPGSIDEKMRSSIGASILWDSPFGPLRGDFAHVLQKATDDQTQVFQLTLSTLL
jgi:outer membrane protein insertion porin family